MAASTGFKEIESGATGFQKVIYPSSSNLNGNKLLYTYAKKTETSTPYGNLFKSFNFPITVNEINEFVSNYSNTAMDYLNKDEIIIIEIPKGEYGELIDGKTFKLTLPVTLNSVETATTVYGTYFGYEDTNGTTFNKKLNKQLSESLENPFGFAPKLDTQTNTNNTNVTFLYSNDIQKPTDKGDEITVLTSSVTITNLISNPYIFTSITFSDSEDVYVSLTSSAAINDIVVQVGNQTLNKNGWTKLNAGQSSINPTVYGTTTSPKNITFTFKTRATNDLLWNVWSATNKFPTIEADESKNSYAIYNKINLNGNFLSSPDKPVGILYNDKGFAVITDPTLVAGFRYSAGTSSGFNGIASGSPYNSGINFAKIYFTGTSESNSQFESITTEFVQNIVCLANANEFVSTTNSTYEGAYSDTATEKPVFITSVGLWNEAGELIGIGKLSEPVKKLPNTIVPFNVRLVI
jgi:hypothetical protein